MLGGNWITGPGTLTFFPLHQLPPWEVKYLVVATYRALEIMMLLVLIFVAKKHHDKALKKEINGIIYVFDLPVTKRNICTYKALFLLF